MVDSIRFQDKLQVRTLIEWGEMNFPSTNKDGFVHGRVKGWTSPCWIYLSVRRLITPRRKKNGLVWCRWGTTTMCDGEEHGERSSVWRGYLRVHATHLQQQHYANSCNSSPTAVSITVPESKQERLCGSSSEVLRGSLAGWKLKWFSKSSELGTTKSMKNWSWDWRFR